MRIIWAIDAFEDNKELNQKLASVLRSIYKRTDAEIEPVYLLQENEIVIPTYEVPAWITDHSQTAESLFKEILEDYHLPFLQKPHVIPHAAQSNSGAAAVLTEYAERTKADLILAGSHGRKGFQRMILGSFTESLLTQSKIPVYLVNSMCPTIDDIKHILFPTEFGEHSKINFRHILKLANTLRSKITLFHMISRPIEGPFEMSQNPKSLNFKGQLISLDQMIENQYIRQKEQAERWKNWAEHDGVEMSYIIEKNMSPLDEAIKEISEKQEIDLITMEAQSGPISAALLGSTLRKVIRNVQCPVYVIPKHYYESQIEQQGTANLF